MSDHSPLYSAQMEAYTVAPCLCDPVRAMPDAQAWVDAGSFYDPRHRELWMALEEYLRAGNPGDKAVFTDFLLTHHNLEACGGAQYVWDLMSDFGWDWANVEVYAERVAWYAVRRGYVAAGRTIAREAESGDPDADLQQRAAEILRGVPGALGAKDATDLHEGLPEFAALDPEKLYGVSAKSGISQLDHLCRVSGPKFVVIGARPGHGKTALAMTYCLQSAVGQKLRVLFYSLEQDAVTLKINFLSQLTSVPAQDIARGNLPPEQIASLNANVRDLLSSFKVTFVESAGWSCERIVTHAENFALTRRPGLVVVDHMNLIRLPNIGQKSGPATKQEAMSGVSADLKRLAAALRCPVMALTQFNRGGARGESRPTTADIRDTGMIEADADIILFPFRPKANLGQSSFENDCEIVIAKNKNESPGRVECGFNPLTMKFLSRRAEPGQANEEERAF